MKQKKNIGIVAHDNRKVDVLEWVEFNWQELIQHNMVPPDILRLKSGPLGGDQQLGAMIAEGDIDILIFFWDPMQPQPHDVDVKALLRITVLYNIPTASNRSTADFIVSSSLFHASYQPILKDYENYIKRDLNID